MVEMVFYSWIILVIVFCSGRVSLSVMEVIRAIIPSIWGNWYLRYYVIFLLFIPFVNCIIQKLTFKEYTLLVALLVIIWSIIPTFTNGIWDFGYFDFFVVMYIIGGFIKIHLESKLTNKRVSIGMLIAVAVYIGVILVIDFIGVYTHSNILVTHATYFTGLESIFSVILSVFTLLFFLQYEFHIGWINRVATSVIGIYLIHDNDLLRNIIWNTFAPLSQYQNHPFLHAVFKVFFVFVICLLIDKGREFVFSHISKYANRRNAV